MEHATLTAVVIASALGIIGSMAGIIGWFASRMVKSNDSLGQQFGEAIDGLKESFTEVKTTQAIHGERITNHANELNELWRLTCQNPNCPHRLGRPD